MSAGDRRGRSGGDRYSSGGRDGDGRDVGGIGPGKQTLTGRLRGPAGEAPSPNDDLARITGGLPHVTSFADDLERSIGAADFERAVAFRRFVDDWRERLERSLGEGDRHAANHPEHAAKIEQHRALAEPLLARCAELVARVPELSTSDTSAVMLSLPLSGEGAAARDAWRAENGAPPAAPQSLTVDDGRAPAPTTAADAPPAAGEAKPMADAPAPEPGRRDDAVAAGVTAATATPGLHSEPAAAGGLPWERNGAATSVPFQPEMEATFGEDFSGVSAYLGADDLGADDARAAASGDSIAFESATPDRGLVAHELTHVVQSRQAGGADAVAFSRDVSSPDDPAEREADAIAGQVASRGVSAGPVMVREGPSARVHLDRSPGPGTPPAPQSGDRRAIDRATDLARVGLEHLAAIQGTLVPAWRAAVAAMQTRAVAEIAAHIVGGLTRIRDAQTRIPELVPDVDPRAPQVSTVETDIHTDAADLAMLMQFKSSLDAAMTAGMATLAVEISPQTFDGVPVAGSVEARPPARDPVGYVAFEANNVVSLLDEADFIEHELVMPTDDVGRSIPAEPDKLRNAVDRLERTKGRPVNFFFLAAVLKRKAVWQQISNVQSLNGKTAESMERSTAEQAKETGTTADVGSWDAAAARSALTYGMSDWAITDADGSNVSQMLADAEPRARGELVMQLVRMNLLDRWASNVPWGEVKAIAESLNDPQAERMLAPYWEDKGGVPSSGEWLTDQAVDQYEKGNKLRAYGIVTVNKALDVFTFGGKESIDHAHEARDDGLISDDAYWTEVSKATGRTMAVGAAAAASGGMAGSWAEGMAAGFGAGQGGAAVIGGAIGGGVGNIGGQFVGDVYDQVLNGKEGFDSVASYGKSFAEGAIGGTAFAGMSLGAARFLPRSAQNMAASYAQSHPHLIKMMEASRNAGVGASVRIKLTVREFLDMSGRGGLGGGGMQPAMAGAHGGAGTMDKAGVADLSTLPPDAEVWVTVRPLADLAAPVAARMGDEGDVFDVESVEPAEQHFDNYGDEASYVDDPNDWSGDPYADDGFGHVDDGGDLGLADVHGRRVRHVGDSDMSAEMGADQGMSVLDQARLGIQRAPRHHTLPQEEIEFFQARGFPGRDIDNFTIELETLDHEMAHGGNQGLARRHWKEREWNTALMSKLRDAEAAKATATGNPSAKLTRQEILELSEEQLVEFGLDGHQYVHYEAP